MRWLFFVLIWFLAWNGNVFAQDDPLNELIRADFIASTQTPLIGEPIELRFTVEFPSSIIVVEYPQFSEAWTPFVLVNIGDPDITEQADGSTRYEQVLNARLWETGDFQTPETFVRYHPVGGDEIFSIPVTPAFFSVPSVLETQDLNRLELKPLKPQIGYFIIPLWFFVVVGGAFVVLVWYARQWLEERRLAAETASRTVYTSYEITVNELIRLRDAQSDEKYETVSNTLRHYLYQRYPGLNRDLTTNELLEVVRYDQLLDENLIDDLRQIFEQVDLAKYANYQPDDRTMSRLFSLIFRWLSSVEESRIDAAV